jgi:hypothetical protein
MSLISILTDPAKGGTFLTWSLMWLAGEKNYFHYKEKSQISLCTNPLTSTNAHGFWPNQAETLPDIIDLYNLLAEVPGTRFAYFHNLTNETNTWPVDPSIDRTAIALAFEKSDKVVWLKSTPRHALYEAKWIGRSSKKRFWGSLDQFCSDPDRQREDFINYFFKTSLYLWDTVEGGHCVWDQREFLALNIRPFDHQSLPADSFQGKSYYPMICDDCWFTLDLVVRDLLDYLELDMQPDRWDPWKKIYENWKLFHHDRMMFVWYFDEIINSILNGTYLDFKRFNLDLLREAVIQHTLLYKYNVNFKTYKLEKFIDSNQLNCLLEPNTCHVLDQTYQQKLNNIF